MQANLSKRINEILVLAVLERGPAHGYQIALAVEEETDGAFTFQHGTLYPILHRLEAEGLVTGAWQEGSRRRKTYALAPAGRAHLEAESSDLRAQFATLMGFLEGAARAA